MLQKNTELAIDPKDPFKFDCLDREESIQDLTNLINSSHQPFVLSIEAPWGWGKTSFIKLWKGKLDRENHPNLYFNAWSNDFADDPLIAFISEMNGLLSFIEKGKSKNLGRNLKKLQKFGGSILRKSTPVMLRLITQGLITEESLSILQKTESDIGNLIEDLAEERIKAYVDSKKSIYGFREELAKFAKVLSEEGDSKKPFIFFIDELDRCRPDYSIALLERIKHLFDVEGVVFILSVDRQQLVTSIKSIYGNDINADGYLRRFIDLRYSLKEPSIELFEKMLMIKYQLKEYFEKRKNAGYSRSSSEDLEFTQTLIDFFNHFKFSLRQIEQIFTQINLILKTTAINKKLAITLLNFLVCLKSYNNGIYDKFKQKPVNVKEIITNITDTLSGNDNLTIHYEPQIIAYVISNYDEDAKHIRITLEEQSGFGTNKENTKESFRARNILDVMKSIRFDHFEHALSHYIDRIENIGHFLE